MEFTLFLIDPSAFEFLLLELFVPLFLLSLLEILEVVSPLVSPLLAFLIEIGCPVLLSVGWIIRVVQLGMRLALIFILISSSWVMVMAPFDDIQEVIFLILLSSAPLLPPPYSPHQ